MVFLQLEALVLVEVKAYSEEALEELHFTTLKDTRKILLTQLHSLQLLETTKQK